MGLLLLTIWSCGSSDTKQVSELPQDSTTTAVVTFTSFVQIVPELSLPLQYSQAKPLQATDSPLESALVKTYLAVEHPEAIIPVGRVYYHNFIGLLYYDEYDPTNSPLWLALYDANDKRISQVIFGGNTDEVKNYFGNILESV